MNEAPTNHTLLQTSIESARQSALEGLACRAAGGGLTLDEYAERASATQQAATADELDALLHGMPKDAAGALAARGPRWLVSVLTAGQRHGPWRLRGHLRVIVLFTVRTLDLGTAQPESPQSLITIITAFGGASIIAPQGVSVQLSGSGVFGGSNDNRMELPPFPGSPSIRIRAFSLFGGVRLEDHPARRNPIDPNSTRSTTPAGA